LKKLIVLVLTIFFMFVLTACDLTSTTIDSSITTTTSTQTEESTTTVIIDDITYPDYPDEANFFFAEVIIYFSYDAFSSYYPNNAKEYYETNNQEFFNLSSFETEGNFDSYYLSSYSSFGSLIYKTKAGFLNDFDLIKNAYLDGYVISTYIKLNTVGEYLNINEDTVLEDITVLTEKYFNTGITYETLEFEILAVFNDFEAYDNFDELIDGKGTYIIDDYNSYLEFYPDNILEIDEAFFETKILIYGRFGHSGSMLIEGVSGLFYLNENELEISVDFFAFSNLMTSDFRPYSFIISMDISDYIEDSNISIHLHGTFLNGYCYDRPHHNTYYDN